MEMRRLFGVRGVYNKQKDWAVMSRKKRTIYACHLTERQAENLVEKLEKLSVCEDASLFYNGDNQLCHRRYDKFKEDYSYIN